MPIQNRKVGLPCIGPELRENWGKIEVAQKKKLPDLIQVKNIRGELETHTRPTDDRKALK
jgi:DNA polymerase (family 10)